ncbi:excalibur calcium-binding domain-containing protein [Dactylosporangium sp. NPDC049742]|uniref:excalibur calcium-binding domain-containing protein n=1 Tax=Dactylosporangium sp. NPDC049742 TaxID=3154737 RepID=UPI00341B1B3D
MSRRRLTAAVIVLLTLAGCGSTAKPTAQPLDASGSASPSASASPSPSSSPSPSAPVTAVAAPTTTIAIPPVPTVDVPTTEPTQEQPAAVYYANCTEVRQAGAAPLHRGEPGYRKALDRDGDGVACE